MIVRVVLVYIHSHKLVYSFTTGNQPVLEVNQHQSTHFFLLHRHQKSQSLRMPAQLTISVVMCTNLKHIMRHLSVHLLLLQIIRIQIPHHHWPQHGLSHPLPMPVMQTHHLFILHGLYMMNQLSRANLLRGYPLLLGILNQVETFHRLLPSTIKDNISSSINIVFLLNQAVGLVPLMTA